MTDTTDPTSMLDISGHQELDRTDPLAGIDPDRLIGRDLDRLAEKRSEADALAGARDHARERSIPAEVLQAIVVIDAQFDPMIADIQTSISALEQQIRDHVLKLEKSVKGTSLQAVLTPGRVTWDTRALDGVAATIPEIARFRRVGQPSVTIRPVKSGNG